ncbi:GspH/FimT family pseudopilin [Thiolinea disciformis]|uniref:GspH/FimT family pseudopilin n=1 Tax=Thiolinea disciformis TaxID=125614 RepID=UPI0003726E5D|nr:GspH/FimT family pseudopilin [Thiolinea disciformis]
MTLTELLITVAISSIMATMAFPNVKSMIERNQQITFTNQVVSSLYLARSEAAKRGYPVTFCASTDQEQCDLEANDYSQGWLVFVDYNGNGRFDKALFFDTDGDKQADTPETLVQRSGSLHSPYILAANVSSATRSITYLPSGQCSSRLFSLHLSHQQTQQLFAKISFAITGRIRACTLKNSTSC